MLQIVISWTCLKPDGNLELLLASTEDCCPDDREGIDLGRRVGHPLPFSLGGHRQPVAVPMHGGAAALAQEIMHPHAADPAELPG
jgi:hypothetical protein